MEISLNIVDELIRKALAKGRCTNDPFGLSELTIKINEGLDNKYKKIGNRYLNETIAASIKKARSEDRSTLSLSPLSLDSIAAFLGFENLETFRLHLNPTLSPGQLAIEGTWYSFARCNSGNPHILISPVLISIADNNEITMSMSGPSREYHGSIKWVAGSLSCYMSSADNAKYYHLAFKVGVVKNPKILQGVFSGISTSGLPIAGKELLVKTNKRFDEMKNHRIDLNGLNDPTENAPFPISESILSYFRDFNNCYIKIANPSTFDLDDLKNLTS